MALFDQCGLSNENPERVQLRAQCLSRYPQDVRGLGLIASRMAKRFEEQRSFDQGEYLVVNVGDSRTYLYRDGVLSQLTRDDSLVQALLESGAITEAEARHHPARAIVMAALDGQPRPEPEVRTLPAKAGDRLLLCSDGLSDAIDDETIAAALEVSSNAECAHQLVQKALDAGGRDNISVIVADVVARGDSNPGWLDAVPAPADV